MGASAPGFGTVKLSASTTSNPDGVTVRLTGVTVVKSSFPSFPDQGDMYAQAIATQSQNWGSGISLQAIQANLTVTQAESKKPKAVSVQNPVPNIITSQAPAVLVLVDGPPSLRSVGIPPLLRVINTQSLLALDQSTGTFYLRVNGGWLQSDQLSGTWSSPSNQPSYLDQLLQQATAEGNVQLYNPTSSSPTSPSPSVYVSTSPAELVVTQGAPDFQPVSGTQLLHAVNTSSSLFMDVPSQAYYLVVSGRWFSTQNLSTPWQFVPSNQLPADFSNIPENDPSGSVLASVSGTQQAQEASIASSIPKTAQISRTSPCSVSYDGPPKFSKIPGTQLSYAVNTATPVVEVSPNLFYAVLNGVWFKSSSPTGPWSVADKVPSSIYEIPPSCPIYYAASVFVYGSSPEYVNVGYTPGYYGTCLSPEGVVVFGTGYNYSPYIGASWIAPPQTYGYGAALACGLETGFSLGLATDHGWGCWPSWGAWSGGWNDNKYDVNGNWGSVDISRNNVYNRWGNNNIYPSRNFQEPQQDFSQAHPQIPRAAQNDALPPKTTENVSRTSLSHDSSRLGEDNVFAGSDGNAYRSSEAGGWQQHTPTGWKPASSSFAQADIGRDLENQRFARNAGALRDTQFDSPTRSFGGGGGFRGGGGRR